MNNQNKVNVVPWYIHSQSNKLTLLGKDQTRAIIDQIGAIPLYQELEKSYGGKKHVLGSFKVFSNFFQFLTEEEQKQLLPLIDPKDFLEHERKTIKHRQNELLITQRKNALITLNSINPKKIILASEQSLSDDEIHNAIWQYIEKHNANNCAFTTNENEILKIVEETKTTNLLLTIIDHWQPDAFHFAIWSGGTSKISAAIGKLIQSCPKIEALRLIACTTAEYNSDPVKPDLVKRQESPTRRKFIFINKDYSNKTPFASGCLMQAIWEKIPKMPGREFSLIGSPSYMGFFNKSFVGSGHCDSRKDPSFKNPNDPSSVKTVCLTTPLGMKAP